MLATACAMPGAPATAPLVGSEWRLEDLGGAAVLDRVEATLGFPEAGRVAGNGSCNRFFGSYTLMSDRIAIGQMGATRMACAGPVGEQEARYLAALEKAERVEVQGRTMRVHVKGMEKPLRYTRTKP
jgi:heat shock protein HslJ